MYNIAVLQQKENTMLVFLVGVGVGMVIAWNVVKDQPKWVLDLYTNITAKLKS